MLVHLYWPSSSRVSGVKKRVAARRIPFANVGVSLSHLNLLSVTPNELSPISSVILSHYALILFVVILCTHTICGYLVSLVAF